MAVTKGKSPRKAVIAGAIVATLPDLDILIPYDNYIEKITNHRTWSHSWIVHVLIAPLFAYLLTKLEPLWSFKTAWLMAFLVLITHSGLDALTVFGTDLFWPFSSSTIIGGSIFIIDPFYTILLLVFCILVLIRPKTANLWRNSLLVLLFSTAYLAWGVTAKIMIHQKAVTSLTQLGINTEKVLVQATPFNTMLWRILVIEGDYYFEGFRSIFDDSENIKFKKYTRYKNLQDGLENIKLFKQLKDFNHGYFSLSKIDKNIVVNDLRMGTEPIYTFRIKIAKSYNSKLKAVKPTMLDRPKIPDGFFSKIYKRILDE